MYNYNVMDDKNRILELREEKQNYLGNEMIKGHEFHYYDSSNNGNDCISTKPITGRSWESSHMDNKHLWGFAHLYYPSNRGLVQNFINAAYEYSINGKK